MLRRILAVLISLSMLLQQAGFAQIGAQPLVSSYMQALLPADAFRPVQMRSLSFDAVSGAASLFVDKGSVDDVSGEALEQSVGRLMDFFYIGLALPNSSFWVNLRPDAQDQIIDPLLEKTDLGKVLLEADLQLKKDLAALTSPKTPQGKAYWEKLYARAESLFGQENAEIPTHTRPWIVPGEIIIKETPSGAYVYKAGLKVMLEQDYAASVKTGQVQLAQTPAFADQRLQQLNDYSTQLIRSTILPSLTRQVNASKKYAQLRQAYYSLVLAQWFKSKRIGSASLLKRIDSKDLSGLTSQNAWSKQTYFNDYKKSFENGEYAMEDTVSTPNGMTVRKYFSGGLNFQAPAGWVSFKGQDTTIDRSLVKIQLPNSNTDGGQAVDIDALLADLQSSSKSKTIAAAARLSKTKDERVVPALGQALLDTMDEAVEYNRGSDVEISEKIKEFEEIARALIGALGDTGNKTAVDYLWEAFQHPFPSALFWPNGGGGIASPVWINMYLDVLLRCDIYRELGKIGGEKAFDLLMEGANRGFGIGQGMGYASWYPSSAIDGLAILGDRRALPLLETKAGMPYIGGHASRALSIVKSMNEQSDLIKQAGNVGPDNKIKVKFFDTWVELGADELFYDSYQVTNFIHYVFFSGDYRTRQERYKENVNTPEDRELKEMELSEVDMRVIRKYTEARMGSAFGRIVSLLGLEGRSRLAQIAQDIEYEFLKPDRDGGTSVGFKMAEGQARDAQRIAVAEEIRKELETTDSSNLPNVAFISDYHGDAKRFAQLLSDALNNICGFEEELNPRESIEAQLNKKGLSLKTLPSPIILGGDLFDRGTEGIECFLMVKEMVTIAPERVFYISGNHDFWAFGNLLGLHLPWYEGFHFYDESTPKQFIDALKGAEEMIKGKRASNPELFESEQAFLWWTERLAEYNADQDAFQSEFFDGKIKDVREQFVKFYADNNAKWNDQQLKAMEDFAGHFARIKVPDPYVGLNGVGKTSTIWWQDLHERLLQAYNARKAAGADEIELAMWDRAIIVCESAVTEVHERLTKAMNEGQWWYFIFEAINTQAYASVEWWCKDWSSHKGWGEAVIAEINRLIDEGILEGPKVDQSNYILSPALQAYAKFCRSNFNLYLKDPYGNLYSHGWFPVQQDASISVDYKGRHYQGPEIFKGLEAISSDVKDFSRPLSQLREGLKVVNTWYADETTIIKPGDIQRNREQIGVAKINKGIGVLNWVTGHNTLDKLDTQFLHQDGAYAHIEADNGMSLKFGGKGGYVLLGPQGIKMRGYEDKDSPEIVTAPASGVNVHVGMSAEEYLGNVLTHLWIEGKDGGSDKVVEDVYHELFLKLVAEKVNPIPANGTLKLTRIEQEALLMELAGPKESLETIVTVLSLLDATQIEELKAMARNTVELEERGIAEKLEQRLQLRPNFGPSDAPRADGGKVFDVQELREQKIQEYLEQLDSDGDDSYFYKTKVLNALSRIALPTDEDVIAKLSDMVRPRSQEIEGALRRKAAELLAKIGGERSLDPLIASVTTTDDFLTATTAIRALAEIGQRSDDSSVKVRILESLDRVRPTEYIPVVYEIGKAKAAILGIETPDDAQKETKEAREPEYADEGSALAGLDDQEWHKRFSAAQALGEWGSRKAVPGLIKALMDKNAYIRPAACEALGKIADPAAVEPLIKILLNKEHVIDMLYDNQSLPKVPWFKDRRNHAISEISTLRQLSAYGLGAIGGQDAEAALRLALHDKDVKVRAAAGAALVEIWRKEKISSFRERLAVLQVKSVSGNAAEKKNALKQVALMNKELSKLKQEGGLYYYPAKDGGATNVYPAVDMFSDIVPGFSDSLNAAKNLAIELSAVLSKELPDLGKLHKMDFVSPVLKENIQYVSLREDGSYEIETVFGDRMSLDYNFPERVMTLETFMVGLRENADGGMVVDQANSRAYIGNGSTVVVRSTSAYNKDELLGTMHTRGQVNALALDLPNSRLYVGTSRGVEVWYVYYNENKRIATFSAGSVQTMSLDLPNSRLTVYTSNAVEEWSVFYNENKLTSSTPVPGSSGPSVAGRKVGGGYQAWARKQNSKRFGSRKDGGKSIDSLMATLKNRLLPKEERRKAADALTDEGAKAVESFIEALSVKDEFLVVQAAQALGKIGDEKAVEPLKIQREQWQPHTDAYSAMLQAWERIEAKQKAEQEKREKIEKDRKERERRERRERESRVSYSSDDSGPQSYADYLEETYGDIQLTGGAGSYDDDDPTRDGGKEVGGVDFRALPADALNASLGMPVVDSASIKALADSSKMTNLDKEWAEIEKLLKAKRMPCEKVKEFVAVCSVRQGAADKLARAQEAILDTIKMEEACAIETTAQEKELLVLLESI